MLIIKRYHSIIDHQKNAVGFIDKYGNPYTCSQIQPPISAIDLKGNSLNELLNSADDISYQSAPSVRDDGKHSCLPILSGNDRKLSWK
ncbi:MAG: hypothetical protein Q8R96_00135 [Bacteroidota bacterium]|nr:hypothetical protein [Bacteroidota bacterium]